jgi:hypothetical protein
MGASMRRAAVGVVAAALLAGCSLTDTPEQEPEHLTPASVEDLVHGCGDIRSGFPGAAKYEGGGPHPIVIFARDLVSDDDHNGKGPRPYWELANSDTFDEVMAPPDSPRDAALLACGTSLPGDEQLNVCTYGSFNSITDRYDTELPLYSQLYTFTVYELRTGRVVDTVNLESQRTEPLSACPGLIEGGTRVYAKAHETELDALFKDLVTGPAT